jgi:hypothetical protein
MKKPNGLKELRLSVQEGGNNTNDFHLIANGKQRKKKKIQLE